MNEKIQTLLSFDFGTHKIGVAVGQTLTKTARPLCILKAEQGEPNWKEVQTLIEEWTPSFFIVGLPLNQDDSESEMSGYARIFADKLTTLFSKQHFFMDEKLSSFAVKQYRKEFKIDQQPNRKKQQKYKKSDRAFDDESAALILQSWFNTHS